MIKKIIALGIIITGFISFSNATFQTVGLLKQNSSINNNFSLGFLRGGGILTDYLGTTKSIIALDNDKLFWWYPDGRPYFYSPSWQGFFTYYDSCPEITYTGDNFVFNQAGCNREIITGDYKSFFSNFFRKVKDDDFVYYTYSNSVAGNQCTVRNQSTIFCWSSREIGSSICFDYASCFNGCNLNNILKCGNGIENGGGFTGSLNYNNLTFGIIPYGDIGYAPGQNGYDGNYENDTNTSITINTQCPTIGQVMANMGNNYNTGLCYNNTTYFNGTTFETIDKQDIFTIFNDDYENYNNRISIYRNNCNAPATATACQTAFSGEYKKYSIIANAINSKVDEKKLRNYCNMGLNYDINATTCTAGTGIIKEDYTPEERLESIIGTINTIPTPNINITVTGGNNNVFNSLCDTEDPENCYTTDNIRDIFGSLQNIYAKITGLFRERNGVNGIIPEYILRIAFVTILFTIIFKK